MKASQDSNLIPSTTWQPLHWLLVISPKAKGPTLLEPFPTCCVLVEPPPHHQLPPPPPSQPQQAQKPEWESQPPGSVGVDTAGDSKWLPWQDWGASRAGWKNPRNASLGVALCHVHRAFPEDPGPLSCWDAGRRAALLGGRQRPVTGFWDQQSQQRLPPTPLWKSCESWLRHEGREQSSSSVWTPCVSRHFRRWRKEPELAWGCAELMRV